MGQFNLYFVIVLCYVNKVSNESHDRLLQYAKTTGAYIMLRVSGSHVN